MVIGKKKQLEKDSFILKEVSFVNDIYYSDLMIQIRYNSDPIPCTITELSNESLDVSLTIPTVGISPGQFGVLYSGTKLIGGGRIENKKKAKVLN